MLLKPYTAFIVGAATVATSISAALGAPGRAGFVFGVVTTVLSLIWALGSRSRCQWAGKFLLRISGPSEVVLKPQKVQPEKITVRAEDPQVFTDTVLALRSLKCDKDKARWAAGQATMRLPNADFDQTFKLAVQIATARA